MKLFKKRKKRLVENINFLYRIVVLKHNLQDRNILKYRLFLWNEIMFKFENKFDIYRELKNEL